MGIINQDAVQSVPVEELTEHPKNPRHGAVDAIAESIRANGFYGALIVQKSTNRVLAGNHRLKALKQLGITEAPVIYVDVNDDRALRILLADNRANDLAKYNAESLAELLESVSFTEDGLLGTLFDESALSDVLEQIEPPNFDPVDETEQGKLDELEPKMMTCPHCNKEFDARQVE